MVFQSPFPGFCFCDYLIGLQGVQTSGSIKESSGIGFSVCSNRFIMTLDCLYNFRSVRRGYQMTEICSENRDSIPDQFHSRKRVQRKPGKDTLSAGTPVNDLSLSGSKEIFLCHYDAFEETEKGIRIFFLCHCLPQKYKSFCQFLRNRSFSKQTKIDIAPSKLKIIHCDRTVKHHGGSIFAVFKTNNSEKTIA